MSSQLRRASAVSDSSDRLRWRFRQAVNDSSLASTRRFGDPLSCREWLDPWYWFVSVYQSNRGGRTSCRSPITDNSLVVPDRRAVAVDWGSSVNAVGQPGFQCTDDRLPVGYSWRSRRLLLGKRSVEVRLLGLEGVTEVRHDQLRRVTDGGLFGLGFAVARHDVQIVEQAGDARTSGRPPWVEQAITTDRCIAQGTDRPGIGAELFESVAQPLDRGILTIAKRVSDQAENIQLRQMLLKDAQDLADRAEEAGGDEGVQYSALAVRDSDAARSSTHTSSKPQKRSGWTRT